MLEFITVLGLKEVENLSMLKQKSCMQVGGVIIECIALIIINLVIVLIKMHPNIILISSYKRKTCWNVFLSKLQNNCLHFFLVIQAKLHLKWNQRNSGLEKEIMLL